MRPNVFIAILGGIACAIGIIALALTISIDGPRGQIACGNGFALNTFDAEHAGGVEDFRSTLSGGGRAVDRNQWVDECESAVGTRRAWGWPLAGLGAAALVGGLVVKPTARREEQDA